MFNSVEADNHRGLTLPLVEGEEDVLHLFGFRGKDPVGSLGRYFGTGENPLISCRQIHGDRILVLRSLEPPRQTAGYDALISDFPGIILTVRTADCIPLLLWDKKKKAAGAVHAGWRGSLLKITQKTVEEMRREFGSSPEDLIAGFGPAAGPCCYEVDEAVLEPLGRKFGYWKELVRGMSKDRGKLDLV
ncbi:MAG TPA: polyphenol oxidase family protein, partial [Nitrospiria bacterium]|nr:polyphenol oxidase family protein [Nitrospiria bacterium]